MKIVIDISDRLFEVIKKNGSGAPKVIDDAILNGTPLPKGHGDLVDRNLALSDRGLCEFHRYDDYAKMRNYLKSLPTIIEADTESEEEI